MASDLQGLSLLRYLQLHAKTELALVTREHACALFHLAGVPCPGVNGTLISIHGAEGLIEQAIERQHLPWLLGQG